MKPRKKTVGVWETWVLVVEMLKFYFNEVFKPQKFDIDTKNGHN